MVAASIIAFGLAAATLVVHCSVCAVKPAEGYERRVGVSIPGFTAEATLTGPSSVYRMRNPSDAAGQIVTLAQGIDDVNGCYDACATLALEASGGDITIADYYYNICRAGCNDVFLRRQRVRS
jgi:hypothetical protein